MTAFPASLPLHQVGSTLKPEPIINVSPVSGSHSRRRRIQNTFKVTQDVEYIFSQEQFNAFGLFVQDDINNGLDAFDLLCFGFDGVRTRSVKIVGGTYEHVPIGGLNYRVNMDIWYDQGLMVDDCGADIIDGGDSASAHADDIDGGDSASEHADDIDGGDST